MPGPETDAIAKTKAEFGSFETQASFERYIEHYEAGLKERQEKLMRQARAVFRAMDGWRQVESEDDWQKVVEKAEDDIRDRSIFRIDDYGTDGPGYGGVLYVIVWGIPKASVLIRTPDGSLEVQAD